MTLSQSCSPLCCQVSQAMSKNYVKVSLAMTLKDATEYMHNNEQNCVLVVNDIDFLEGILTYGDVRRYLSKKSSDVSNSDSRFPDVSGDEHANLHPFFLNYDKMPNFGFNPDDFLIFSLARNKKRDDFSIILENFRILFPTFNV